MLQFRKMNHVCVVAMVKRSAILRTIFWVTFLLSVTSLLVSVRLSVEQQEALRLLGWNEFIDPKTIQKSALTGSMICEESPSSALSREVFNQSRSFRDFLVGPALQKNPKKKDSLSDENTNDAAVCLYRHELKFSNHFPHAMQQLYRCISWWFAHPGKEAVLIFQPELNEGRSSEFMTGFLDAMKDALHVKTVRSHTSPFVRLRHFQSYVMQNPTDAPNLRDRVLSHYNMTERVKIRASEDFPRIAILNRKWGEKRNLKNIVRLSKQLSRRLPENPDVPVMYFKNKTFLEQVDFFAKTDIVISPHGAQLTGIPFMPDCGAVLELFPKGYYLPAFFGTLANVSNLNHAFLYLSEVDGKSEYSKFAASKETRLEARGAELCPPVHSVVQAVEQLVKEWKQCRMKQNEQLLQRQSRSFNTL
jgi:hypothetical protein